MRFHYLLLSVIIACNREGKRRYLDRALRLLCLKCWPTGRIFFETSLQDLLDNLLVHQPKEVVFI